MNLAAPFIRRPIATTLVMCAVLLFGIPLFIVNQIMVERGRYHRQVLEEIARSTAGPQTITGPLLVVRYRERLRREPAAVTTAPRRTTEPTDWPSERPIQPQVSSDQRTEA